MKMATGKAAHVTLFACWLRSSTHPLSDFHSTNGGDLEQRYCTRDDSQTEDWYTQTLRRIGWKFTYLEEDELPKGLPISPSSPTSNEFKENPLKMLHNAKLKHRIPRETLFFFAANFPPPPPLMFQRPDRDFQLKRT